MPASASRISAAITRRFSQIYPSELARFVESLGPADVLEFLSKSSAADAASALTHLSPDAAARALETLSDEEFQRVVPHIDPTRAAALLRRLGNEVLERRITLLDRSTTKELRDLMSYPPDTAGALMDPRVLAFHDRTTVSDVTKRLRKAGLRQIAEVFVIDADAKLVGAVPLQRLAVAEPKERLGDLSQVRPVGVLATAPREEVLDALEEGRLSSVPVVDFHERVIGVIRQDALITAVQADATADVQTIVGVSRDERALSSVAFAVRHRLPWLQVNLVTAFLAAAVVGLFEGTIAQFTALAVLLPVVAGQSGNTGAQALAVTIRGLALREITARHWWRLSLKEIGAGSINGVAVAVVTALAVLVWSGSAGLAAVIGCAMVISMGIAGLAGASIPIILTRLGQDPAQSSSIVLTTVTDVMGFLSFLGLATLAAGIL